MTPVGQQLSATQIRELWQRIDALRVDHGIPTGTKMEVAVGAGQLPGLDQGRTHTNSPIVWHLSLTNPAGDRVLTDAEWGRIAQGAMDAMGFTEVGGKAPVRWVAIRHGLTAGGNEHLHVAVSLVRGDGTRASVFRDYKTKSAYAQKVEQEYGLERRRGPQDSRDARDLSWGDGEGRPRRRSRATADPAGPHRPGGRHQQGRSGVRAPGASSGSFDPIALRRGRPGHRGRILGRSESQTPRARPSCTEEGPLHRTCRSPGSGSSGGLLPARRRQPSPRGGGPCLTVAGKPRGSQAPSGRSARWRPLTTPTTS